MLGVKIFAKIRLSMIINKRYAYIKKICNAKRKIPRYTILQ